MSDLQQRLAEDLHRVAADLDVPPPPLASLTSAGRRRLRHKRTVVLVAVAAAVVVISGVAVGSRFFASSAPLQPTHPGQNSHHERPPASGHATLQVGPPPTIPFWHDGMLFLPTGRVRLAASSLVDAGNSVLIGQRHAADGTYTWWQVTDASTHRVSIPAGVASPQPSPDGRLVVWEEVHPQVTRLVAWNPVTDRVLAWKDVRVQQGCCGGPVLMLFGVDNAGQAFYGTGRALAVWDTRTNTAHTVTGLGDLPPQPDRVTATGIVLQGQAASLSEAPGVYGTVDASGAFHRTGTVPWSLGAWSSDGTLMEYPGDDSGQFVLKAPKTTVLVLDPATGKTVRMRFPHGYLGFVGWESNDALLIEVTSGPAAHDMLRCQAATGACEITLRGVTDQWRFPTQ